MALGTKRRRMWWTLAALLATASVSLAQAPAPPAPPPTAAPPAAPPSPVSGIRSKLSADDLLSAESILEVHRTKYGEDGAHLAGLSWLARGALLLGEPDKARRFAVDVRARCADRIAHGADLEKDRDLETALGAAIEVEAQLIQRGRGARAAEKAEVDSIWKTVYTDAGSVPVVFSTASMERYGGSSTPTWVFVDRAGIVRGYVPYRLTDAAMDHALEKILR